jgi:hypothetical protein
VQPHELDYISVVNACCDVFSALYAKFVDPSLSRAAVYQALLRVDAVLQVCILLSVECSVPFIRPFNADNPTLCCVVSLAWQDLFIEPVEQGLSTVAAHATARELRGVSSAFYASDNAFSGIVNALDDESARTADADR